MVDFFLLVLLSGAGDELQGMKRGVMEMADMIAINKADGANLEAAQRARMEAETALHYFPASRSGWRSLAQTCSAQTHSGIPELWQSVLEYVKLTQANGWFNRLRQDQTKGWMHEIIEDGLRLHFESNPAVRKRMTALEQDVLEGRATSFRAARTLLDLYAGSKPADAHPHA
jgi:LAO/AO transport system kinase